MRKAALLIFLVLATLTTQAAPLEVGIYDDTALILSYSGTWGSTASGFAFGNSYANSSDFTAQLTFSVFTSGFTVYFVTDPAYGSIDVCIDGDCTPVSQTANTARGSVTFENLASGEKEVVIKKTADDATVISFDAVYNHPGGQEVSANLIETTFTYDSTEYVGLYDLRITAGEAAIVLMLVFVAIVQVLSLVWMIRK